MIIRKILGVGGVLSITWWLICGTYFWQSQSGATDVMGLLVLLGGGCLLAFTVSAQLGIVKILPKVTNPLPELIPILTFGFANTLYSIVLVQHFGIWPSDLFERVWVWMPIGTLGILFATLFLAILRISYTQIIEHNRAR